MPAKSNSDMYWTQLQVTGILWKLLSEQEQSQQQYFFFWNSRVGHCNTDPETPNELLCIYPQKINLKENAGEVLNERSVSDSGN